MDDLKFYAKNDDDLKGLLNTVKLFSNDLEMQFGLKNMQKSYLRKAHK